MFSSGLVLGVGGTYLQMKWFILILVSLRGGELSLFACPGVGNRTSSRKIPGDVSGEGRHGNS